MTIFFSISFLFRDHIRDTLEAEASLFQRLTLSSVDVITTSDRITRILFNFVTLKKPKNILIVQLFRVIENYFRSFRNNYFYGKLAYNTKTEMK